MKGITLVDNVITTTEKLREELEKLITQKGISDIEVLKMSQRLDEYILMHYWKKVLAD